MYEYFVNVRKMSLRINNFITNSLIYNLMLFLPTTDKLIFITPLPPYQRLLDFF